MLWKQYERQGNPPFEDDENHVSELASALETISLPFQIASGTDRTSVSELASALETQRARIVPGVRGFPGFRTS